MTTMTKEQIAEICHEVNRAYCQSIGDHTQLPWNEAPAWAKESAVAGVELHCSADLGAEASHEAWSKHKQDEGWTWGPVKDAELKEHPCLVPFGLLPVAQQSKDYIFRAIVHSLRGYLNE